MTETTTYETITVGLRYQGQEKIDLSLIAISDYLLSPEFQNLRFENDKARMIAELQGQCAPGTGLRCTQKTKEPTEPMLAGDEIRQCFEIDLNTLPQHVRYMAIGLIAYEQHGFEASGGVVVTITGQETYIVPADTSEIGHDCGAVLMAIIDIHDRVQADHALFGPIFCDSTPDGTAAMENHVVTMALSEALKLSAQ
jgi:hypothetical protein